jgi:hypothetical protein
MKPLPPTVRGLQERLAHLRRSLDYLEMDAKLGADVRGWLVADGSPAWDPAEDNLWRRWIECYGDENAKRYVVALDKAFAERMAKIRAAESHAAGSPGRD